MTGSWGTYEDCLVVGSAVALGLLAVGGGLYVVLLAAAGHPQAVVTVEVAGVFAGVVATVLGLVPLLGYAALYLYHDLADDVRRWIDK